MYGPAVKDVRPWKDITYVEIEYVYINIYTEKSKIERTQRHIIRYIFTTLFWISILKKRTCNSICEERMSSQLHSTHLASNVRIRQTNRSRKQNSPESKSKSKTRSILQLTNQCGSTKLPSQPVQNVFTKHSQVSIGFYTLSRPARKRRFCREKNFCCKNLDHVLTSAAVTGL